jgi:hypothetical protein
MSFSEYIFFSNSVALVFLIDFFIVYLKITETDQNLMFQKKLNHKTDESFVILMFRKKFKEYWVLIVVQIKNKNHKIGSEFCEI